MAEIDRSDTLRHHQKSSIDLSLELERELNNETEREEHPLRSPALDPDVLSSLVVQLRHTIAELTQTRDDLLTSLAHSHAQEAELRDSLSLSQEQRETLVKQLEEIRECSRADQDTITLLRQKVEESRQGLMRLQSEQRRQSTLQLDLSKSGPTSKAAKRSSFVPGGPFTPLTGSGFTIGPERASHRRVSSVSDQGTDGPSSPNLYPPEPFQNPPSSDSEALDTTRLELLNIKQELADLKGQLAEANEAKEASESCAKALREFIAEHRIGEMGHQIPPLPPETSTKKASGWTGLRLWRTETPNNPSTVTTSNEPSSLSPTTPDSTLTPVAPLPLARKLGEFFTRSMPAHTSANGPQDTMFNGLGDSDASSLGESDDLRNQSLSHDRNGDTLSSKDSTEPPLQHTGENS